MNLMSGKASSWLTANRERLINDAETEFRDVLLEALKDQVQYDLSNIEQCELLEGKNRHSYSLFLEAMAIGYGADWIDLAKKLSEEWLNLNCPEHSKHQTYNDAFGCNELFVAKRASDGQVPANCDIAFGSDIRDLSMHIMFSYWLKTIKGTIQIIDAGKNMPTKQTNTSRYRKMVYYQLKREYQPYYNEDSLSNSLASCIRGRRNRRYTLHCEKNSAWSKTIFKRGKRSKSL